MRDFLLAIATANFRVVVGIFMLGVLFSLIPGQSKYEMLNLQPQAAEVKGVTVEIPERSFYPVHIGVDAPMLTARGAIAVDVDSGVILYQKNIDLQLLPASTTKIMTALVVLEEYNLDDVFTVKQASNSVGHSMHLVTGERISVESLLYGVLVESGNDAAFALAQNYPNGGYQGFVKRMNEKASELSLDNTQFRNVSGVEQYGHVTTVRDLAILTKAALKNDVFSKMVVTEKVVVNSIDRKVTHVLHNINQLLGELPGIKGVKTGWTEHAGECLVTVVERSGREIITVVLGSEDRFGESAALVEWVYGNYRWEEISI